MRITEPHTIEGTDEQGVSHRLEFGRPGRHGVTVKRWNSTMSSPVTSTHKSFDDAYVAHSNVIQSIKPKDDDSDFLIGHAGDRGLQESGARAETRRLHLADQEDVENGVFPEGETPRPQADFGRNRVFKHVEPEKAGKTSGSETHNFFGKDGGHVGIQIIGPQFHLFPDSQNQEVKEPRLFDPTPTPPQIDELSSTSPAHTLGVVGAASQSAKDRWGSLPVPSKNLSAQSLPIVQKLERSGALPAGTAPSAVSNNWDSQRARRREMVALTHLETRDSVERSERFGNQAPTSASEDIYPLGKETINATDNDRFTNQGFQFYKRWRRGQE